MKSSRSWNAVVGLVVLAGIAGAGYLSRASWLPSAAKEQAEESSGEPAAPVTRIIVNEQAQKNLGLTVKAIQSDHAWRTITVPGMVVDRPGISDRGVVSPVTGIVSAIHRVPGNAVRPGDPLFTLKLLSESLHLSQTDLFKTTQDVVIAEQKAKRLKNLSSIGTEAELAAVEAEAQVRRLAVAIKAYRQELLNRGLASEQIDAVAEGRFVNEIAVFAPQRPSGQKLLNAGSKAIPDGSLKPAAFELQELKVELGQQVQAGQTLCYLANHQMLSVEGKAFSDELPLLERSFKEGWPVQVEFTEDAAAGWGEFKQTLSIRYIANSIDPVSRTASVILSLENESKTVDRGEGTQLLWRFRPGQKVRLLVRVEKLENVFVLPTDALVREDANAFVFLQNVNTFERKPVRLLLIDRKRAILANDGSLVPGSFVVQSAAVPLNRMLKSGGGSGVPKGYHIHADGSLHKNEDEAK
jgi:cobalt-zinc-cadmium efflux system membrane fusion protein